MTKKSSVERTTVLDLEKTISADVQAKLYYLCKQRGLLYPEGVVFLLKEVSEPTHGVKYQVRGNKKSKNGEKQGRAKAKPETSPRSHHQKKVATVSDKVSSRPKKVR